MVNKAAYKFPPQDLRAFEIQEVSWGGKRLRLREPLRVMPKLMESREFLCLEDESLGLYVIAASREELLMELQEQLYMLWEEYAQELDENLTESAKDLKEKLLREITVV